VVVEARRRNDAQAIKELDAVGPPTYDSGAKEGVLTKWATRFEPGQMSMWGGISLVLFESPAGLSQLRDYIKGLLSSDEHFRSQQKSFDVASLGAAFVIPFFVFQGAEDNVTPVQPVRAYVDSITAPRKQMVLIPNAGHNVMATRSDEFLKELLERVRPLTTD
jgi:pimeloyl-ACP methyl ester carboxylesterase